MARAMLNHGLVANLKVRGSNKQTIIIMKKFLLSLIAVAAVLLPLSQNAQAHWVYYHRYYVYHHWHHRYWHDGYWYAGCWHPGYWYPGPVTVVVDPY